MGRASSPDEIARAKQEVRERTWSLLERAGVARFPGARGRISNFVGAEDAVRRLANLPEWREAGVVKANPDSPQLPVRALALEEGKRVFVAVPRLRDERPFLLLDPRRIRGPARKAASIKGSSRVGRPVRVAEMQPVELVVCGTVAVNRKGVRVGKGGGYSDLELGLLIEEGRVTRLYHDTVLEGRVIDQNPAPGRELEEYYRYKRLVTEAFVTHGGALSHHHAVGLEHQAWVERELTPAGVRAIRGMKATLDPHGIMNPGKMLQLERHAPFT